jgi:small conductance mechanosensitive channel
MNITPLITGAGILGLAFSFGAQTLVKDLIAGFFIILENQYNVGDQVKLNTEEGVVDKITLRATVLKDKKGNLIYIPNSEIKKVVVIKKK